MILEQQAMKINVYRGSYLDQTIGKNKRTKKRRWDVGRNTRSAALNPPDYRKFKTVSFGEKKDLCVVTKCSYFKLGGRRLVSLIAECCKVPGNSGRRHVFSCDAEFILKDPRSKQSRCRALYKHRNAQTIFEQIPKLSVMVLHRPSSRGALSTYSSRNFCCDARCGILLLVAMISVLRQDYHYVKLC
ncbi:hypothetical protein PCE1_003194 [Barthelona sp. PCE]